MLKALGVAFIICTALLFSCVLTGLCVWAVSSGTVQIAGINQSRTGSSAVGDGAFVSRSPSERNADSVVDRQSTGHESPVPVRPAAMTTVLAAPLQPPTGEQQNVIELLRKLDNPRLDRMSGTSPTGPIVSWAPSSPSVAVFSPTTSQITFFYRSATGNPIATQSDIDALNLALKATNVRGPGLDSHLLSSVSLKETDPFVLSGGGKTLQVHFSVTGIPRNSVVSAGIAAAPGFVPQFLVAPTSSQNLPPRIGSLFNGKYQKDSDKDFAGLTANVYPVFDYLRLRMTSQAVPAQTHFYIQKTDGSVGSGINPVTTTLDLQESTVKSLSVSDPKSVGQNNMEYSFIDLQALKPGEDGYVFAVVNIGGETLVSEFLPIRMLNDSTQTGETEISSLSVANTTNPGAAGYVRPSSVAVKAKLKTRLTSVDVVVRTSDRGEVVIQRRITGSDSIDAASDITFGQFSFSGQGPRDVQLEIYQGNRRVKLANETVARMSVSVFDDGPAVSFVNTSGFSFTPATSNRLILQFGAGQKLDSDATNNAHFVLTPLATAQPVAVNNYTKRYVESENAIVIEHPGNLAPGSYRLTVEPTLLDAAKNPLGRTTATPNGAKFEITISKNEASGLQIDELVSQTPTEQRGLTNTSGPYVKFDEYTKPRSYPEGFNPSDKVVTRVARLYYFRDAHRVSQIVNRKARSFNRAAVDMKQQFADAKKRETDLVTEKRRELEKLAVRAAQQSREAENALDEQQRALISSRENLATLEQQNRQLTDMVNELQAKLADAPEDKDLQRKLDGMKVARQRVQDDSRASETQISQIEARVRGLMARVQTGREVEVRATQQWESADEEERRRLEDLFRREVAAKTEDPDTYTPGLPESTDPVEQVSISVVGEGLIQLRGPRKGVNEVHKMINELDSPVGQVKVAVHTVQVNGEHGDRMEEVVHRIQRYLDHSRFLTMQSAQMLRNAVVTVASRRAEQVVAICPPGTPQQDRDYRYQEAFFGAEFVQELKAMDSEFLKSGNKVLALHSMDTTSLSNALFLISLAKNDVRQEILTEFMTNVQCSLPQYEIEFYQGSAPKPSYKDLPLKQKLLSADAYREKMQHRPEFQLMAQNAQFASLRGFFDTQISGGETLSPMQREFIRLAQIFKARLITEIELRQRVMERSLIEERMGNYTTVRNDAIAKEKTANDRKQAARLAVMETAQTVRASLAGVQANIQNITSGADLIIQSSREIRTNTDIAMTTLTEKFTGLIAAADGFRAAEAPSEQSVRQVLFPNDSVLGETPRLNARIMGLMDLTILGPVTPLAAPMVADGAPTTPGSRQRETRDRSADVAPLNPQLDSAIKNWGEVYPPARKSDPGSPSGFSPEVSAGSSTQPQAHTETPANSSPDLELVAQPEMSGQEHFLSVLEQRSSQMFGKVRLAAGSDSLYKQCIVLLGHQFTVEWSAEPLHPGTRLPKGVLITDWVEFRQLVESLVADMQVSKLRLQQFRLTPEYDVRMKSADKSLETVRLFLKNVSDDSHQDDCIAILDALRNVAGQYEVVARHVETKTRMVGEGVVRLNSLFSKVAANPDQFDELTRAWTEFRQAALQDLNPQADSLEELGTRLAVDGKRVPYLNRYDVAKAILTDLDQRLGMSGSESSQSGLLSRIAEYRSAAAAAENLRRPLDHKKFLDMLIDDVEEKFIELVEGTRAQTSNIDNYLKRMGTALEDDFNSQFYHPAFRNVRSSSYYYDVSVGQVETTSVVANNRAFAKVSPQATMEFDLPKRDILINEAMNSALAAYNDYGALLGDPNFLSLMKMYGGQSPSTTYGGSGPSPYIQEVLPGLPSGTDSQFLTSPQNNVPRVGSNLEALIPDPAVYKFETGTGYEIRPVIQPDGQSVVFHFNYMYTTNVREPVRADEKHLGRVKRHFIDTDVVSGNYELREISTYQVGLKAARTSRGVPFLEDVPGVGTLFRPAVSAESSLQENIVLSQSVIYPTLFDLMGLRWAPAVADLDSLSLREREFVTRNREKLLRNEVFDYSSLQVDEFMRIPDANRRGDLYRTQESIPELHPNQYQGSGLNLQNGVLQESYSPEQFQTPSNFTPNRSEEATFPLESVPRTPVLSAPPGMRPVYPVLPDRVQNLEGAVPLDGPHYQGSASPQRPTDRQTSPQQPLTGPVRTVSTQLARPLMAPRAPDNQPSTRTQELRGERADTPSAARITVGQRPTEVSADKTQSIELPHFNEALPSAEEPLKRVSLGTTEQPKGMSRLIPGIFRSRK